MAGAERLVRNLFSAPGQALWDGVGLLRQAASAHADLLADAMRCPSLHSPLAPIADFLNGSAPYRAKLRLLCHPLFLEGLHAISPFCSELRTWHEGVTWRAECGPSDPCAATSLGNVALSLLLQTNRSWSGRCELRTDAMGRIGFPCSDWNLFLCSRDGAPLSNHAVSLTIDHDTARWRVGGEGDEAFLVMPRADCIQMLSDGGGAIDGARMTCPDASVQLRLTCSRRLGRSRVRFDPIAFQSDNDHSSVAGGLISRVVAAIRQDSPGIYREFATYIRTVRCFEFPRAARVASFSDPTLPGVMGVSVSWTEEGEPCLDPFCFTWFGHELGHTKDYICDTILHSLGQSLVANGSDWSAPVARYGRPLMVRTLIQVPYVHLYEWELLMDFWESDFRGLPWRVPGGADAVGDDLEAEIEESFNLIADWAELTPVGVAAVDHFHEMFDRSQNRWRSIRRLRHAM